MLHVVWMQELRKNAGVRVEIKKKNRFAIALRHARSFPIYSVV